MTLRPPHDQPWFVEVVIDTGQRLRSETMAGQAALAAVADMCRRMRVISAAAICETTGEAIERPSLNLMASTPRFGSMWMEDAERRLLAEALAPVE